MGINIIKILDTEGARQIASHINRGEFSLTEANNALADSVKGISDDDHKAISAFFKRAEKLDDCIVYLD